jgi:GWxTD domain-containing protein
MKHKVLKFAFFVLLGTVLSPTLSALDLGVSYAVMATPAEGYIEINLEISPGSIGWERIDSTTFRASADVLILMKKGDQVFAYEKYTLNSPVLENPSILLDIKRLAIPNGEYELEITAIDKLNPTNTDVFKVLVKVDITTQLYLTDIQLLRSFSPDTTTGPFVKNGYFLEPLPFNFYDRAATIMAFYTEIYQSNTVIKEPVYQLRYIIEKDLGNNQTQLVAVGNQKKRPSVIDAAVVQMDISQLESGNYRLTVELRNKQNELLSSRSVAFQRSNPYLNIKEEDLNKESLSRQFVQQLDETALRYSLKAISPLVTMGKDPEELKNILFANNMEDMRYFLFRYFVRMDANNPEMAWRAYMETANAVDKKFTSGFRYGFETDRGRTFMKYGKPDDLIHVEDDPSAPPYEIWVYYNFPKTNQRNVKFLFYNPTLAGDDFITLHSTARGEINNPKWETKLYKRNAGNEFAGDNDFDATQMKSNVNRNARVYFEDF